MKIDHLLLNAFLFFIILINSQAIIYAQTEDAEIADYIKQQKSFYGKITDVIKSLNDNNLERDINFDPCPIDVLHDDFLGFKFVPIHTEQAGFLDCDGPTYLRIYDNGMYDNHTGNIEYKCYLKDFDLKTSGLKSGIPKIEIIESYGLPIVQSENMLIYGCKLDVDPFAGMEEDEDIVELDENDPNNYILDLYFIFEKEALVAIVYITEHHCY